MYYQEYTPSLHLRPFVEKFWTLETNNLDSYPMELLLTPNGAEGFIIHPKKANYKVVINNELFGVSGINIIMPYNPWKVLVAGPTQTIGVFFKAGSLHALLKSSMTNIVDQVIELEAFIGSRAVRELKEHVQEAALEKGIIIMEQFFSNYFCSKAYNLDTVRWGVQLIRQSNGKLSIEQLAAKLGISRQSVARQFAEKVGVSPKYYSRIIHFNAAFQFLKKNPHTSWIDLTYRFDYFDQSHMIKDFYHFTGASPKGFAALVSSVDNNNILDDLNLKLL